MTSDFGVVVNADDELITQGLCLSQRIGVSEVYHVVAGSEKKVFRRLANAFVVFEFFFFSLALDTFHFKATSINIVS